MPMVEDKQHYDDCVITYYDDEYWVQMFTHCAVHFLCNFHDFMHTIQIQ